VQVDKYKFLYVIDVNLPFRPPLSLITVTPAARQSPPLHPLESTLYILVGASGTYLYSTWRPRRISTSSFKLYHQSSEMSA